MLAEQHHRADRAVLEGLTVLAGLFLGERPVRVELLTNRTTRRAERSPLAHHAGGEVDILVGTHALLYGDAGSATSASPSSTSSTASASSTAASRGKVTSLTYP